ncbi:MAG: hypothetical protein K6G56_01920 [Clostridiales bacterium]|nr:hypothetical protein [Clostridiales bacterium]
MNNAARRNKRGSLRLFTALLLAAALLFCGCDELGLPLIHIGNTDAPAQTEAPDDKIDFRLVEFGSMPYRRPDLDAMEKLFAETAEFADGARAGDAAELERKLDECWDAYDEFFTLETIAMLRSDIDQTDEYYSAEYEYFLDREADIAEWMDTTLIACACSKAKVSEDLLAGYTEEDSEPYSDRMLELMARENSLLIAYREALMLDEIEINGEVQSFTEYVSDPLISDEEYAEAKLAYYRACNEIAAPIYAELVKVRRAMAEEYGCSYEELQYYSFGRDYTPEQVSSYLEGVAGEVADYYCELMESDPYSMVDYWSLSESGLLELLEAATSHMGESIKDSLRFMEKYHLYDAAATSVKSTASYTVYLRSYDAPFCFLGAYGDAEDFLNMAHEFGHFADARINYDSTFSLDLSETYSQGMANLALLKSREYLSPERYNSLLLMHLLSNLSIFAEQTAYADFESRAYALPDSELTVENLNALALECADRYGASATDDAEGESAFYWTQVNHLFEQPFYVISYCISADAAIQIAEMEMNEPGSGVAVYEKLLDWESGYFLEELSRAGLVSPFSVGRAAHNLELVETIVADELSELMPAA